MIVLKNSGSEPGMKKCKSEVGEILRWKVHEKFEWDEMMWEKRECEVIVCQLWGSQIEGTSYRYDVKLVVVNCQIWVKKGIKYSIVSGYIPKSFASKVPLCQNKRALPLAECGLSSPQSNIDVHIDVCRRHSNNFNFDLWEDSISPYLSLASSQFFRPWWSALQHISIWESQLR